MFPFFFHFLLPVPTACRWSHGPSRMKNPAQRTRDIERQPGYLKREHCAPPPPHAGPNTMWFIRDGCGIVCGAITWFLVFYAEFVVVFVMLLPAKSVMYSLFNGFIFNGLAFLALASHAKAMCTDPVSVVVEYLPSLLFMYSFFFVTSHIACVPHREPCPRGMPRKNSLRACS